MGSELQRLPWEGKHPFAKHSMALSLIGWALMGKEVNQEGSMGGQASFGKALHGIDSHKAHGKILNQLRDAHEIARGLWEPHCNIPGKLLTLHNPPHHSERSHARVNMLI
eukprot:668666-Pelagomonas_calceolata.AAC.1